MGLREFLETVQVKCEEAKGLCLAGNDSQGISVLQQVATIISSEFGATDEVAAASPEVEVTAEEAERMALMQLVNAVRTLSEETSIAINSGHPETAKANLAELARLLQGE